jgi:hypothetical protein
LFIVAITLGLLAAMGIYGLSATAYDVRASGAGRAAAQGQHAAELSIVMASQVLTTGNAQTIVNRMRADHGVATEVCKTAKMYGGSSAEQQQNRAAEACMVLTPTTMGPLAVDTVGWPSAVTPYTVPFTSQSFGDVPDYPKIRVELTNPVDYAAPAGFSVGSGAPAPIFTSVRTTVFVEMRPADTTQPADSVAQGRGRLILGPYMP